MVVCCSIHSSFCYEGPVFALTLQLPEKWSVSRNPHGYAMSYWWVAGQEEKVVRVHDYVEKSWNANSFQWQTMMFPLGVIVAS